MKTKKLLNSKTLKRKRGNLHKLTISKQGKLYTVFATTHNGINLPIKTGTLQAVISEAEQTSAHYALPVEHHLNKPVTVVAQVFKKVSDSWLWAGREVLTYPDAEAAYLSLRAVIHEVDSLEIEVQSGNVKRRFSCSQDCTNQWETILHRLKGGEIPSNTSKDECARCFSQFVKNLEGGGTFCLNCGYGEINN